jgi:hypothetical protein
MEDEILWLYKDDASEIDCPFLDQPINYSWFYESLFSIQPSTYSRIFLLRRNTPCQYQTLK